MKGFFLLLMIAAVARAEPELLGVLTTNEKVHFSISLGPDGPSKWVEVGATIDGYLVLEYRSEDQVLVLKKGQKVLLLKLKAAKVRELPLAQSPGSVPPEAALSLAQ